jgi:RHS repeat-associated protein
MTRGYDDIGQLVQQQDSVIQFDFSYDAVGNIVSEKTVPEIEPDINLEMTYGAANRLGTYDGSAVEFDADGNMTKGPLSGGMADFVFDSRNRLVQAGDTVYRYDAENQRIAVNQIQYVVNSQPALSQVLVKTEADGTQTYYVYGLGLIGQESNGEYLSYHFDLRGSTVALTDKNAQVVERFQYSPYGLLMGGDSSITPFLFNGMYGVMTDGNGLYYMRARFYSPEIRRFVNQDVLLGHIVEGQTLNRYAYVTGRPGSLGDPFGLETTVIITTDYYWFPPFIPLDIIPFKIGSHAAMMIDNNGNPILYDPAGSYKPSQAWENIPRDALGDVFQSGEFAFPFDLDLNEYLEYHTKSGSRITLLFFQTTPEEEQELAKRIKDRFHRTSEFYCTIAVSSILDGVGPFKGLGIFVRPGSLRDELLDRVRKR